MKRCSYCGRENQDVASHCYECGTSLAIPVDVTESGPRSPLASCVTWVIVWHLLSFLFFSEAEEPVIWFSAVLAFWCAVVIAVFRKQLALTGGKAWLFSHGLVVTCVLACCIFYLVARLKGEI